MRSFKNMLKNWNFPSYLKWSVKKYFVEILANQNSSTSYLRSLKLLDAKVVNITKEHACLSCEITLKPKIQAWFLTFVPENDYSSYKKKMKASSRVYYCNECFNQRLDKLTSIFSTFIEKIKTELHDTLEIMDCMLNDID